MKFSRRNILPIFGGATALLFDHLGKPANAQSPGRAAGQGVADKQVPTPSDSFDRSHLPMTELPFKGLTNNKSSQS